MVNTVGIETVLRSIAMQLRDLNTTISRAADLVAAATVSSPVGNSASSAEALAELKGVLTEHHGTLLSEILRRVNDLLALPHEASDCSWPGRECEICQLRAAYDVFSDAVTRCDETAIVVVNINTNAAYDTYIGRGSKWGNPFFEGTDGTRDEVIEKYREWIQGRPELLKALPELRGKRLGCHCAPKPCHGDVLKELVERVD